MAINFLPGVNAYTDQDSAYFRTKIVAETNFLKNCATVTTGQEVVAGQIAVPILGATGYTSTNGVSCTFTDNLTSQISQAIITMYEAVWGTDICLNDFRAYFTTKGMTPNEFNTTLPNDLAGIWLGFQEKNIATEIERRIIQGSAGSTATTGDLGLVRTINATGSGAAIQSGATAWTVSNAQAQAKALVSTLPTQARYVSDIVIITSTNNFDALVASILQSNFYNPSLFVGGEQGAGNNILNQGIKIPGTNVTVYPIQTILGTNTAICYPKEQLYAGIAPPENGADISLIYNPYNAGTLRFQAGARYGVKPISIEYFATNGL